MAGRIGPDVSKDPITLTYKVKRSKSILDPDREATTTLTFQTTFPAAPLTVPTISQFSVLFVGGSKEKERSKKYMF